MPERASFIAIDSAEAKLGSIVVNNIVTIDTSKLLVAYKIRGVHGGDYEECRFLNRLNGIHQCIQFTMETETEGHLPLLDIDIYRRPDSSLGHRVYCKPTHTNLYLCWIPPPPIKQASYTFHTSAQG
jgi:hypothetical protein